MSCASDHTAITSIARHVLMQPCQLRAFLRTVRSLHAIAIMYIIRQVVKNHNRTRQGHDHFASDSAIQKSAMMWWIKRSDWRGRCARGHETQEKVWYSRTQLCWRVLITTNEEGRKTTNMSSETSWSRLDTITQDTPFQTTLLPKQSAKTKRVHKTTEIYTFAWMPLAFW